MKVAQNYEWVARRIINLMLLEMSFLLEILLFITQDSLVTMLWFKLQFQLCLDCFKIKWFLDHSYFTFFHDLLLLVDQCDLALLNVEHIIIKLIWNLIINFIVMIKSTRWINEIYKSDMTMWYFKQTQNEYILW